MLYNAKFNMIEMQVIIALAFLMFVVSDNPAQTIKQKEKNWAVALANSFIKSHPDTAAYAEIPKSRNWNYEQGLVLDALLKVYNFSNQKSYFNYVKKNIDYYIGPDGSIKTYRASEYNLDNVAPGKVLLYLYKKTGELKYKKAADTLREQLRYQPRTKEGGFWHKKIYPYQMWLDGLYMAEPFYLLYSLNEKDYKSFDDIANQFIYSSTHMKDNKSGLYYHGWDESRQQRWADSIKGTSPNFWGRSMGWYLMALSDVLEYFPKNHSKRSMLIKIYKDLSSSVLNHQDPKTKLWFQVTDKLNEPGNYIESSSSLMFIYSFAKGANLKILDKKFLKISRKSFDSVISNLVKINDDGTILLNNVCSVAGLGGKPYRDGSYEYYINEPKRVNDFKGYGPFILAAVELQKNKYK